MARKIIKETKYCKILSQASLADAEYTYCIERIYIKDKNREEIRFSLYKDTTRTDNRYIPRSLDVTELELIELIKVSLKKKIFSNEFLEMLKQEVNNLYSPNCYKDSD